MGTFSGQASLVMSLSASSSTGRHFARAVVKASGDQADLSTGASPINPASSDQSFELAAGASLRISWAFDTNDFVGTPNSGDVRLRVGFYRDNQTATGSNHIRNDLVLSLAPGYTLGAQHNGSLTFHATSDGTATGTPLSGTYRIVVGIEYGQVNADATNGGYIANSDGSVTLTGATNLWSSTPRVADKGYLRASTEATLASSLASAAHGESVTLTADLAATAVFANPLTLVLGPSSGSSNTVTDGHTRTLTVNNVFPAAPTVYTPSITVPNSALSGRPWTVLTVTASQVTVDPRITVDHHMQKNNNTFDANLDVSSRLTSDLGFVGFTLRNAKGSVVPSITCTETLTDQAGLVAAAINRSVVSDANGRPPTLAAWDSQLPGGGWVHTVTFTSPSTATGLEQNNQATFTLLAASPSMKVVAEGGPPLSSRAEHFTGVGQFQTFVGVIDVDTQEVLSTATTPAVSTADVALFRVNPFGVAQFLNASGAWANLTPGVPIDFHVASETAAGSGVFVKTFVADDTWGTSDVVVLGRAVVGGTPYGGLGKEIAVGSSNGHAGYALDVLASAGFPQR